jgi:exodeoxyribonuclease V beta subunit
MSDLIDTIDPSRHAILEASAGTGKTYAIGRYVLRLLREGRARLDQILLVTFTEKATGELKDRLRRELEAEIDSGAANPVFRQALDQYDQAPIFTIHGFCNWLLTHFASELGQDFRFDLVDDQKAIEPIFREVQKREWHRAFEKTLAQTLKAADYQRSGADDWERKVRDLANRYRPDAGHRMLPDPSDFAAYPEEYRLAVLTVRRVQEMLAEDKRQRGQLSYDDMIARVAHGLDPARNPRAPALLAELRERFRFAVIDEFQDTEPLQWDIFRRLFLDGPSRLILVGDPKQAIYGFRGADLPTYVRARRTMLTDFGAAEYPLTTNWRSTPELLDALNRFFDDGAFFPKEGDLKYHRVSPPPAESCRTRILRDDSRRSALTVFNVDSIRTGRLAREQYAELVAEEIRSLLYGNGGEPTLELECGGKKRMLQASDIGLLVFTRNEAKPFIAALGRRGIAHAFYKKGGVRESAEARDVRHILRALSAPHDEGRFRRALLTMFFRVPPADAIAGDTLPATHPARELFSKWRILAEERRWSALFDSLLEETGILFHERDSLQGERRLANLRLILGNLQFDAYQGGLDLLELLERTGQPTAESNDNPLPENDEPRVQFLTIHSAKGLEFPVVFLAGNFTDGRKASLETYRDEESRLVFDLPATWSKSHTSDLEKRRERSRVERREEQRRLVYVAMTRAQLKLYVPYMMPRTAARNAAVPALVAPTLFRAGIAGPDDPLPVPPKPTPVPGTVMNVTTVPMIESPRPLFPAFDPKMFERRISIQSFTRLQRQRRAEQETFGDDPTVGHDEAADAMPPPDDPFHGAVFGEMVHHIFEQLDFAAAARAESPERLDDGPARKILDMEIQRFLPRLAGRGSVEQLAPACRQLVRTIVWNTLRTPLKALGTSLSKIGPDDRLEELEFLLPADDLKSRYGAGDESWFVTGYMDLVVRWRDKLWLLDWKTNQLPAYSPEEIGRAMAESDYHLQYRLYVRALDRWLRRVHGESAGGGVSERIGGVFYLFVRGMNGRDDKTGVFFVPGSAIDISGGKS